MNDSYNRNSKSHRHKVDLLTPEKILAKVMGILVAVGVTFWAFEWNMSAIVLLSLAGIIFAALMVMAVIDAYQDDRLGEFFIGIEDEVEEGLYNL